MAMAILWKVLLWQAAVVQAVLLYKRGDGGTLQFMEAESLTLELSGQGWMLHGRNALQGHRVV